MKGGRERLTELYFPDETHETLVGGVIGEATLVVAFDPSVSSTAEPRIATSRVLQSKQSSNRQVGQKDIFIETRKKEEPRIWNIWGGLGEFVGDQDIPIVKDHLFFIAGGLAQTSLYGRLVGLSVLVYDGPLDREFHPISDQEVAFNGWMSMGEILSQPNVRTLARQFTEIAWHEGIIVAAIREYTSWDDRLPVFGNRFSIEDFNRQRDGLSDVVFTLPPDSLGLTQSPVNLLD